jgi:hypothetical protein
MKMLLLFLFILLPVSAASQVNSLPPIAKDALLNPGVIMTGYDRFTDKSKIEFIAPLQGDIKSGLSLFVLCTYDGRRTSPDLFGRITLMMFSEKPSHKDEAVIFLIDSERVEITPNYQTSQIAENLYVELLILPAPLNAKHFRELSEARSFKGRVGGFLEFEINHEARKLFAEFAKKMDGR